jgi:hypothetical protein
MGSIGTIVGDLHVAGTLSATTTTLSAGSVSNAKVAADADIDASKLEHQHSKTYEQESDTTSVTETRVIHVVYGTVATVVAFEAGSVTVCAGAATIDVDLLKNGVSILTAAITLDNGNSVRVVEAGTISSPTLADGDVLEVDVTATAGGGTVGKGVFASCIIREDASP